MNKTELVEELSSRTGLSKVDAKATFDAVLDIITKSLAKGNPVVITGFGSFASIQRKEKTGINPITKAPMTIAAKNVAKFKPGKELKEALN